MGEVVEVKKADIFKNETKVSNPWLDPKFNKIDDLRGEPGFKVDDIPERLGLVQQGFDPTSPSYYFTDLEDTPRNYGTKLQFVQTDGKGKLSWAWPFWSKAGSTVYYKTGKVAIGHAAARTVLHVLTPTASEVRIETSGASDPTLSLKTTNTAHQVNLALDESAVADHVDFIGQTASVDTLFHIIGQAGQTAKVGVQIGSYRGEFICGSAGAVSLKNITADLDLVLGIKDGAVNKTITWDADVDQLKHSAGLFDFHDDNILTTGTLGAGNATLGTIGCGTITVVNGSSINLQEDITFTGATAQNLVKFPDNLPTALDFREGATSYLLFRTSDGTEGVTIGKALTLSSIAAGVADYDKFLVSDSGVAKYRTGVQVLSDIDGAAKGANSDITSMSGITGTIVTPTNLSSKTTGTWTKSIGAGGDYPDWATMIAAMPDLIAHAVTVTIKTGTTLSETCNIRNKHGTTASSLITIKGEKQYPANEANPPTADSATVTTLRDAVLVAEGFGNDYFNGCWIQIIHGTGTDNGPVAIIDYVDATGDVVVAAWPGTQPDNTSRYIIVGALIDGSAVTYPFHFTNNTVTVNLCGVGVKDGNVLGFFGAYCSRIDLSVCGFYNCDWEGVIFYACGFGYISSSGVVLCNTDGVRGGGVRAEFTAKMIVEKCGISDNVTNGIYVLDGSYAQIINCFGDANGNWGTYAIYSGQVRFTGTECSGVAGNHSDPGTAGNANADQASAY